MGKIREELGERGNNDQNILYENIFQKKGRKEKKNKFGLIIRDYRFLPDGLELGESSAGWDCSLRLTGKTMWQHLKPFNFTNTHTLL